MIKEALEFLKANLSAEKTIPAEPGMAVVVPQGYTLADTTPIYDRNRLKPKRVSQIINFDELESFAAYWKRFSKENSILFASFPSGIRAIFDYHSGANADWCQDQATFAPPPNPDWLLWLQSDKVWMTQPEFAAFLEKQSRFIVDPPSAVFVDIARTFSADISVHSSQRLQDGSRAFSYTVGATSGNQTVKVPEQFRIALPMYVGMTQELTAADSKQIATPAQWSVLDAAFRFRVNDGGLKVSYELFGVMEAQRSAYADIRRMVEQACGQVTLSHANWNSFDINTGAPLNR